MDLDKNRIKEPGFWRMLLGALALGCAILVGFVLGLRAGDKSRKNQPVMMLAAYPVIDSMFALPDSSMVVSGISDLSEDDSESSPEVEIPAAPADKPALSLSKQQIAQGVEYLASHNRWNRDEMESIPSLAGLWDAVNTYQIDEIRRFNESLVSTPLTSIVEGLELKPKKGYYAAKADRVITLSTYIKRLR